ncbi:hypothetical protein [Pseudomonas syringae]|uniref:hypothetical protein n=1 Tax=Pseudomonas syringae TaxID=317 RepID=UPI000422C391|nr:hypothetical protein [Pseudomonas syringae]
MNKQRPDLQLNPWPESADTQDHSASLILYLIAIPLFILATLLILNGLFSESLSSTAIGVVGAVAALVVQFKQADH